MHVVIDGRIAGLISAADPIKDTTLEALKALKKRASESSRQPVTTNEQQNPLAINFPLTRFGPMSPQKTKPI